MMTFIELIEGLGIALVKGSGRETVAEIVYDSRHAGSGAMFCALPGANDKSLNGHDFCADAYERGCRMFLCSCVPDFFAGRDDVSIALADDTRAALARISARFFGYPAQRVKFIALTGTKGKTTISYMLRSIFEDAGKKVGLIGSNGVMYPQDERDPFYKKLLNTTPESYVLHGFLKDMADAGVEYVFLEATSQGFMMHRTDGIVFDAALYTNIAPDHISKTEHESFDHYFSCKKEIFHQTKLCFVNRDTELFDQIVAGVPKEIIRTYGFSKDDEGTNESPVPHLDYAAKNVTFTKHGSHMSVEFVADTPTWEAPLRVDIPGRFNAENALGAICIADHFGLAKEAIASGLARTIVDGRMEYVDVPAPYTVLIDFAHNRLSMEAMFETARAYHPNRILCVFGLEGDRAHIRRFDSGEILGREADYTILSDASPRTDDPDQILADIAAGIERSFGGGRYKIVRSRYDSIPMILDMAQEGDLVLLIGKGNVLYEEVHGVNTPINERTIVQEYFAQKGSADEPFRTPFGSH